MVRVKRAWVWVGEGGGRMDGSWERDQQEDIKKRLRPGTCLLLDMSDQVPACCWTCLRGREGLGFRGSREARGGHDTIASPLPFAQSTHLINSKPSASSLSIPSLARICAEKQTSSRLPLPSLQPSSPSLPPSLAHTYIAVSTDEGGRSVEDEAIEAYLLQRLQHTPHLSIPTTHTRSNR